MSDYSASYMDDMVISVPFAWADHLHHLRQVLQKLQEAGFTAKGRKCQFGMQQCAWAYLGHELGMGCLRPEADKVEAIRGFPTLNTKSQVRTFPGLAGYHRKFVSDFATVATLFTDLQVSTK